MQKCSVCRGEVNPGASIRHECQHWSHTKCLTDLCGDNIDFDSCPACTGSVTRKEPVPDDGIDYVVDYRPKSAISGLFKRGVPQCVQLLNQKVPIENVIFEHDFGLQHLIRDGVVIDDFLNNGYTIDDLLKFEDIRGDNGQERAQQALLTLGLSSDHILMHSDHALPPQKLKETVGIGPKEICQFYGLYFDGPTLDSSHHKGWSADDVIQLGFSMDDLIQHAGMQDMEQYISLGPSPENEHTLGVTTEHIAFLERPLVEEQPIEEPYYEEKYIVEVPKPRVVLHRRIMNPVPIIKPEKPKKYRHGLKF